LNGSLNWSVKIARLAGIDVYMHWTFLLLLGYVGFVNYRPQQDLAAAAQGIALVMAVFVCVVLHELGHALTARRYGIGTLDITLLPIGGVARLERMPDDPRQELWVALAGPAVNVVIAAVLLFVTAIAGIALRLPTVSLLEVAAWATFLRSLMFINVLLVFFNMLPAFPMDGGRVLRALLARRFEYARATELAVRVGQVMAFLFGMLGLFGPNPLLIFIALFVYLGAEAELRSVRWRLALAGVPVRAAMRVQPVTVGPDLTLSQVAEWVLNVPQRDFPVVDGDQYLGMLRRDALLRGLSEGRAASSVAENMGQDGKAVDEAEPLDRAVAQMNQLGVASLPVTQLGRFVGLLTLEDVGRFFSIRAAQRGMAS